MVRPNVSLYPDIKAKEPLFSPGEPLPLDKLRDWAIAHAPTQPISGRVVMTAEQRKQAQKRNAATTRQRHAERVLLGKKLRMQALYELGRLHADEMREIENALRTQAGLLPVGVAAGTNQFHRTDALPAVTAEADTCKHYELVKKFGRKLCKLCGTEIT